MNKVQLQKVMINHGYILRNVEHGARLNELIPIRLANGVKEQLFT